MSATPGTMQAQIVSQNPPSQIRPEAYPAALAQAGQSSQLEPPASLRPTPSFLSANTQGPGNNGHLSTIAWQSILNNLPTKSDLRIANENLSTTIMSELHHIRTEIHGLTAKVTHLEGECDTLRLQAGSTARAVQVHTSQMQSMALHLTDLDNRGRRQNLRLRGLPETEDSPSALKQVLLQIFNALLDRPPQSEIDFVRAHRALRPKGPPGSPPQDVICCLSRFDLKEELLRQARVTTEFSFEGVNLQLFPDLAPATLAYRRAFKPLTSVLLTQQIRYRWQMPTGLSVTTPAGQFLVQEAEDLPELARLLQLPPISLTWPDPLALYNGGLGRPRPRPPSQRARLDRQQTALGPGPQM
uniref:Uncharacterized protein n=1 Tax=Leptobrachium leishanense TaxID=445787 RepID=A0A8C5PJX4_9ANUR